MTELIEDWNRRLHQISDDQLDKIAERAADRVVAKWNRRLHQISDDQLDKIAERAADRVVAKTMKGMFTQILGQDVIQETEQLNLKRVEEGSHVIATKCSGTDHLLKHSELIQAEADVLHGAVFLYSAVDQRRCIMHEGKKALAKRRRGKRKYQASKIKSQLTKSNKTIKYDKVHRIQCNGELSEDRTKCNGSGWWTKSREGTAYFDFIKKAYEMVGKEKPVYFVKKDSTSSCRTYRTPRRSTGTTGRSGSGCKEFISGMDGRRVHKRKPVAIRGHFDSGVSPEETAIGWQIEVASHLTNELEPRFLTVAYSTKLKEKQPQMAILTLIEKGKISFDECGELMGSPAGVKRAKLN